jgi:hypothetical protein
MNKVKYEIRKSYRQPLSRHFGYICFLYVYSDKPLKQITDSLSCAVFYVDKHKNKSVIKWRFEDTGEATLSEQVELKIEEIKKILDCEPELISSEYH